MVNSNLEANDFQVGSKEEIGVGRNRIQFIPHYGLIFILIVEFSQKINRLELIRLSTVCVESLERYGKENKLLFIAFIWSMKNRDTDRNPYCWKNELRALHQEKTFQF